tara:strand:+ start:116 stop:289 length:174 start_codon:yes stop_codon:yes gene_type:complete
MAVLIYLDTAQSRTLIPKHIGLAEFLVSSQINLVKRDELSVKIKLSFCRSLRALLGP